MTRQQIDWWKAVGCGVVMLSSAAVIWLVVTVVETAW